jgi:hypothetical protein
MAYMLSNYESYIDRGNEDPYCREDKKEVVLVVDHEITGEQVFHQVHTVLDHHGTQPGQDTDDHTEYHDEVSLAHMFYAPDEKSTPDCCTFH